VPWFAKTEIEFKKLTTINAKSDRVPFAPVEVSGRTYPGEEDEANERVPGADSPTFIPRHKDAAVSRFD
jgi:hypothetical protein